MASIEERLRQLVAENLEVDGRPVDRSLPLTSSLSDAGVTSLDRVAFAGVVQKEFSVTFTPEHCAELQTLADLVRFLEANAA